MGANLVDPENLLWTAVALAGAIVLALIAHAVVFAIAGRASRRTGSPIDDALVRHARKPARFLLPVLACLAVAETWPQAADFREPLAHGLGLLLIAGVAWLLIALTATFEDVLGARYRLDVKDNLAARRVLTQSKVLQRVLSVLIGLVAAALMLMTIPAIRQLGASLLASAGLAGLVVGMAARPTLSNLLAGIQIALTEPIRIDDVVIVEGEWGRIEEIRGSYVVVRIWDLRRLIVPLTYFIDHPFQNWTRVTADLLGSVFVYVDYRVAVEEVRQELKRILEASGMWDGKVCALQVTDANDRTMELRALMSAPDASAAWDLRCHVREKLIAFLQGRHPESLPILRAEVRQPAAGAAGA